MSSYQLVIVGAGGHGREIFEIARAAERDGSGGRVLGIVDDREPEANQLNRIGAQYLGKVQDVRHLDALCVIGIGDPPTRRGVSGALEGLGVAAAPPLVHPSAVIGTDVQLGDGCVVFPFVSMSTNVRVGRHSHFSTHVSIAHDVEVGDFVSVYPGARVSGAVHLEDAVLVGAQASVLQGQRIGLGATVGAGATVIGDVAAGTTVVGTPARPMAR